MKQFYGPGNTIFGSCEDAAHLLRQLLQQISKSGRKTVSILEVGCGTGMLTEALSTVLVDFPELSILYDASDVSIGLATQAARRASYKGIRPRTFDLSQSPTSQGYYPLTYDLIVGLHVLHAVPYLQVALGH